MWPVNKNAFCEFMLARLQNEITSGERPYFPSALSITGFLENSNVARK
jgi:hypothetical protein